MSTPYAVVIIKPMSVRRGDAPLLLAEILQNYNVSLRMFRQWVICTSTWSALLQDPNHEVTVADEGRLSWVCMFTGNEGEDPTERFAAYFGPEEMRKWNSEHLRYRYSGYRSQGQLTHPSDTVVWLSNPNRVQLEASLLFKQFDGTLEG